MHRWLLVPFPALAGVMGLAYLFGDPGRTSTQSFVAARDIATLHQWGYLFLLGAAVTSILLVLDRRTALSWALWFGGAIFTFWATLFAISAATDPRASLTGWAVHGTIASQHFIAAWWIRKGA